MNQTDTHTLILQYMYGETDEKTSERIEQMIHHDPELQQYCAEITEVRNALNSIKEQPNPTSVAIISEHSHDSHTEAV